jgi:hypothetical protein
MPEASHVVDLIVSILEESPNKSLLGSKLSVLLKSRCPDFNPLDYDLRTFREFIRSHVSRVYESSRQGLDVIYSLSPVQVPEQGSLHVVADQPSHLTNVEEARRVDNELWKTYVSPSGPYRLFVNRDSNEFRVVGVREESPSSPPWLQVPPCSAARHKQIAEEFVASLPGGEAKTNLAQLLTEKIWWIPFFEKTRHLDLEKQWLDFRRSALVSELRKTLASVGVDLANLSDLKQQGATSKRHVSRDWTPRVQRDVGRLRSIALEIVGRVNESELRDLRFRLGDVLDALSNR